MVSRTTQSMLHNQVLMSQSRATAREFDDAHLMQQIKHADVYHSETPSDVERFQPVGLTAVPLKQSQSQTKQSSGASTDKSGGDWNTQQPDGDAAEVAMMYMGGSRSHPVAAVVDDRRVRPYNMAEGEGAHYAPDGSEQMTFFNKSGAYLVSLDGKSVAEPNGNNTRMASLRHVSKDMQTHEIKEGEQQQPYKHEGKSVNTEVRCTAGRIEFRSGDTVVGYYDKGSQTWYFKGKIATMEFDNTVTVKAPTISNQAQTRFETVGPTFLAVDSPNDTSNCLNVKLIDDSAGKPLAKKV